VSLLVFDSGIGGLGVVAELRRLQPQASMTYLADSGFYPYGEKSDDVLIARILHVIAAGIARTRPDAVVIACNTASTVALTHLRAQFALPFIGCVPPIKPAAAASQTRHIGLLATAATIRRPYLQGLVQKFAGDCTLHSHGTGVLADLAEAKFRGQPVNPAELQTAIAPLFTAADRIDTIALGCTHYTFLLPELIHLRPDIKWFDPAGAVARQTAAITGQRAVTATPHATAFFTARPNAALECRLQEYGFTQSLHLPIE
jgi:glutamate racemase